MAPFEDSGLYGDVNNDNTVDVLDALIVSLYNLNFQRDELSPYAFYINLHGDVDESNTIDLRDAMFIAKYEINPNDKNLPKRLGRSNNAKNSITNSESVDYKEIYVEPEFEILRIGNNEIRIEPSITLSAPDILIGASSAELKWDSKQLTYKGVEGKYTNIIVEDSRANDGILLMSGINRYGTNTVVFPALLFETNDQSFGDSLSFRAISVLTSDNGTELVGFNNRHQSDDNKLEQSTSINLFQNSPNPFNSSTVIPYCVSEFTNVLCVIYNIQGQKIKTLVNKKQYPGFYKVRWDGTDEHGKTVSTGIYIYQMTTDSKIMNKHMLLIK